MHRLARRVLRLGSFSPARQGFSLCTRTSQQKIRTYATDPKGNREKVDVPTLPHPAISTSFERLFFLLSLLKPGQKQLNESEMAVLIAGLLSSTKDYDDIAKIEETILPIMEGYDLKKLHAKIGEARKTMNSNQGQRKAEELISRRLGVGRSKEGETRTFALFRSLQSP